MIRRRWTARISAPRPKLRAQVRRTTKVMPGHRSRQTDYDSGSMMQPLSRGATRFTGLAAVQTVANVSSKNHRGPLILSESPKRRRDSHPRWS